MKTSLLLFLLLFLGNSIVFSQSSQIRGTYKYNKTVHVELIDNKYKKLSLIATNYKSKDIEYKGTSTDGKNWFFKIPDSVYSKALGVCFKNFNVSDKEAITNIDLCYTQQKDTFMSPNFINFDNTSSIYIKLKYIKRASFQHYLRDSTSNVKIRNFIFDFYEVKKPDNETILSIRENLNFCWFNTNQYPHMTYEDFLIDYINLIKQHPDSKTLLSMFLDNYNGIRIKCKEEDMQLLFNAFSKKIKDSYIGKIIKEKLFIATSSSKFKNIKLENSVSHNIEPIIVDSTKFNLIIFSASWCSPCHKLIPLLKEVNNDLHQKLNLIYISIDEKATVKQWENLLYVENISWRSLSAYSNLDYIQNKFLAYSIPTSWLIYPNGKMEILDIREPNDKEKLYKIIINK